MRFSRRKTHFRKRRLCTVCNARYYILRAVRQQTLICPYKFGDSALRMFVRCRRHGRSNEHRDGGVSVCLAAGRTSAPRTMSKLSSVQVACVSSPDDRWTGLLAILKNKITQRQSSASGGAAQHAVIPKSAPSAARGGVRRAHIPRMRINGCSVSASQSLATRD